MNKDPIDNLQILMPVHNEGYSFFEVDINHKKRKYGNTKIFHFYKLPRVAFINLVGLIKIKFFYRD